MSGSGGRRRSSAPSGAFSGGSGMAPHEAVRSLTGSHCFCSAASFPCEVAEAVITRRDHERVHRRGDRGDEGGRGGQRHRNREGIGRGVEPVGDGERDGAIKTAVAVFEMKRLRPAVARKIEARTTRGSASPSAPISASAATPPTAVTQKPRRLPLCPHLFRGSSGARGGSRHIRAGLVFAAKAAIGGGSDASRTRGVVGKQTQGSHCCRPASRKVPSRRIGGCR
jgi:hypothetical protein